MSQQPRTPKTPLSNPGVAKAVPEQDRGEQATDGAKINDAPTLGVPNPVSSGANALAGQIFGDFELVQEIGRGGMGSVYKARQRSLDREVALKLLLGDHASNPALLLRFLAEARAAASLTHPNIITIYQVGECIVGPYFVMEYIDGPSLESSLAKTLPVNWSLALMTTVAEAVQHAHSKNIIHRDLKPGNIMLHHQKRPVVLDFGLAKVLGGAAGLTNPGMLMGTPAYMPPEQAGEEPNKVGPHSDVYSLGAILYALLTGRRPFEEETALRTILKVISKDPPPPIRDFRPDVPPRLEQIAMKCLEKDPTDRYPTAQAFAEELKRYRNSQMAKTGASAASFKISLPTVVLVTSAGKQLRLFNTTTVVGRASDCDLVLKSSEVSKRHCRILIAPDQVVIEDLGSVNGTSVNGEPIERVRLRDGDELDIAGHIFEVRLQGATK